MRRRSTSYRHRLWQQGKARAQRLTQQLLDTPQGAYVAEHYIAPLQQKWHHVETTWPAAMPLHTMRRKLPTWLAAQERSARKQMETFSHHVQETYVTPVIEHGSQWLFKVWPAAHRHQATHTHQHQVARKRQTEE